MPSARASRGRCRLPHDRVNSDQFRPCAAPENWGNRGGNWALGAPIGSYSFHIPTLGTSLRNPHRLRLRGLISAFASLALAVVFFAGFGVPAQAQPSTTIQLTKEVTVPTPPASTFAGAASGDGWDVQFLGDRIFNVFHHNSNAYQVDCHLQSDGSHCDTVDGVSPWPKTVVDPATSGGFSTPGHSTGAVDTTTGHFYGWTTRVSDDTGGVLCVDLSSSATNPYCGFTPMTAAGEAQIPFTGSLDGGATIGSRIYAYNSSGSTTGAGDKLLCFDTATGSACPDAAVSVDGISSPASMYDWTAAIDGKVFVAAGTSMGCYDPTTAADCAGSWPVTIPEYMAKPFAHLTASGTADGVCVPLPNDVPCWDFSAEPMAASAALSSAIAQGGNWESSLTLGARVFVAGQDSNVYCFDFSTSEQCPNFPKAMTGSNLLYTLNADPQRFGCIWTNADSGSTQIQNFDAFTGASGCGNTTRVAASSFISQSRCAASGWVKAALLDPAPGSYASSTLDVTTAAGVPVSGASNLPLDGAGSVDLSNRALGSWPTFGFTMTDPTFSAAGITIQLTWNAPNIPACAQPDVPTNVSAVAGHGVATLSWTAPVSDGGSPITSYTVSAAPNDGSCTAVAPATSCTVPGLKAGRSYSFTVTASNKYATSDPSTASPAVTPAEPQAPGQPTDVVAHSGGGSITVSWKAPAGNGGSPITKYVVTADPGGASCTVTGEVTSCVIAGLQPGAKYRFTVVAYNAVASSDPSEPTSAVTVAETATAAVPVVGAATFAG